MRLAHLVGEIVAALEHEVGAELLRRRRAGSRLADDRDARTLVAEQLHHREPDRPGPVDDREVVRLDRGLVDRVDGGGEHLDERALRIAERIGQLVRVRRLGLRELREAAVGGHAEHRQVRAELRLPGPARIARAAALDRADRDAVTLREPVGTGDLAEPDDLAGELVPEHERPLARRRAHRALAVVVLHVGAAEAAGRDLDEDLVLGDDRLGHLLDADVLLLVEDCCFHDALLSAGPDVLVEQGVERDAVAPAVAPRVRGHGIASTAHHLPV